MGWFLTRVCVRADRITKPGLENNKIRKCTNPAPELFYFYNDIPRIHCVSKIKKSDTTFRASIFRVMEPVYRLIAVWGLPQ
jgi:hypothetical protein